MKPMHEYQNQRVDLLQKIATLNDVLDLELAKAPSQRSNTLLTFIRVELDRLTTAVKALNKIFSLTEDRLPFPKPSEALLPQLNRQLEQGIIHLVIRGGLGDVLCCTPALGALRKKYPDHSIRVTLRHGEQVPDVDNRTQLFKGNPNIDILDLQNGSASHESRVEAISVSLGALGTDVMYRNPAAEIIAGAFGLRLDSIRPDLFLEESELANAHEELVTLSSGQPIVSIGCTSRQPANQNWPLSRWHQLVELNDHLTFIQLGLPDEPKIEGAHDFRSLGELRKSIALLSCSDLYVGMDTFWGHASAAVETPGVVLFGGTHPSVFSYPDQQILYKNLSCSPCHNFLMNDPCPYRVRCITEFSVEDISTHICAALG